MLKIAVILIFGLILFSSCDKGDQCEKGKDLPLCIEDIINRNVGPLNTILSVQGQNIDGENHYWLNTDARFFDGSEVIINSYCDTVCMFCGFCVAPPCFDKYTTNWDTIWKRK